MNLYSVLTWLHVVGNVFWIGAICGVGLLLTSAPGDAKTRGELAQRLYLRVAVPGFVVSFLLGMGRLLSDMTFFKFPWMHAKLLFAFIIIGLHHVVGAKAKKMAKGEVTEPGKVGMLTAAIAVLAVAVVFFVIVKVPMPSK